MKINIHAQAIIGPVVLFLLLVSCSSSQTKDPTSHPDSEAALPTMPTLTTIPPTKKVFIPTPTPNASLSSQPQIEVIRDIPYTSQLKLDVYKPHEPGPWPVVIALHGGGQNKELFNLFSKRIAQLGAVVFTPTWRSSEPKGEQITRDIIIAGWEDAACVLRFARAKSVDYDGNPARMVVVGYSGGGTAGAVMALAGDDFDGDCLVSGISSFPDVFVGVDGAYDLVECCIPESLYSKASPEDWDLIVPYTYIDRQPIHSEIKFDLIVGGTAELVKMAETFNQRLTVAGYESNLTQFPGLDHGEIVSLPLPELFGIIKDALFPK
jgi:acetyl esterase/lipase